jgi:hypothetical protein
MAADENLLKTQTAFRRYRILDFSLIFSPATMKLPLPR